MLRVLIIGGGGVLGSALQREMSELAAITLTQRRKPEARAYFDAESKDVGVALADFDSVIYLAGLTSMKACELDRAKSERINFRTPARLAELCRELEVHFTFVSSSAAVVYDGLLKSEAVLLNQNRVKGASTYGLHKYLAEREITQQSNAAVVRLSKVAGPRWPLVSDWIMTLRSGGIVETFHDHLMSPVTLDFAVTLLGRVALEEVSGVVSLSASDELFYTTAASALAKHVGCDSTRVIPRSTDTQVDPRLVLTRARLDTSRAQNLLQSTTPTTLEVLLGYL